MLREIKKFVEILEQVRKEHYDTAFGLQAFPEHLREHIEVKFGKKYAKLVCVNKSGNVASAWGFIALEDGSINGHKHCAGDLLKPASFSRPTAISRGSICVTIGEKKGAPASFNVYGPDCVKSLKENLKEK
jgi:hypothetical protein